MAPKDFKELEDMLEFAVGLGKPVVIRYPRGGEDRIKLSISIKDCTIPNSIKELLDKKEDATLLNIA